MTLVDLFYAAVITSCSVGYGDYSFDTQAGRGLCTLYAIAGVPMVAKFVTSVSSYIIDAKQEELIQKSLKRQLKIQDLTEMDEDGDGNVDRGEFLAKMLVKLGKYPRDLKMKRIGRNGESHFEADFEVDSLPTIFRRVVPTRPVMAGDLLSPARVCSSFQNAERLLCDR